MLYIAVILCGLGVLAARAPQRAVTTCSSLNGPHCFAINHRNVPSYLLNGAEFEQDALQHNPLLVSLAQQHGEIKQIQSEAAPPTIIIRRNEDSDESMHLRLPTHKKLSIEHEDSILQAWQAYLREKLSTPSFDSRWKHFVKKLLTKPRPLLDRDLQWIQDLLQSTFGSIIDNNSAADIMTKLKTLIHEETKLKIVVWNKVHDKEHRNP